MKKLSAPRGVRHLPVGLRLVLARIAVWRLKHGQAVVPTLLMMSLVTISAAVGYGAAIQTVKPSGTVSIANIGNEPDLGASRAPADYGIDSVPDPGGRHHGPSAAIEAVELGQIQAELVRLRVLFLRLAELAEIDDGEFDLDLRFDQLSPSLDALPEFTSFNRIRNDMESADRVPPLTVALAKQWLVHISEQSARLHSLFQQRRLTHDFTVSGTPVAAGSISSRFGYRIDPETGRRQIHRGLDFGGSRGSAILALADGIVTYAGRNGGYGNLVELEHPDGYRTRYAHNESVLVPLGQRVKKGQAIATMGSTGRSTGTHVHVEVRHEGRAVDPQLYIH